MRSSVDVNLFGATHTFTLLDQPYFKSFIVKHGTMLRRRTSEV